MSNENSGFLQVNVTSSLGLIPIRQATVQITRKESPETAVASLTTDESGQTTPYELSAPNLEYSLEPSEVTPYAEYNITVEADGYETVSIFGVQILATVTAFQQVELTPMQTADGSDTEIVIPDHTLSGDYPEKIPEEEIKPLPDDGEIVLSRVVIPEYIVVHDGVPSDSSAKNYYVKYKDYIKNVVSSEIYATWNEAAIYANTLVVMSFTLNRVFTEYYRGKGYNFTITSSTAYDQKWIYGQTIYSNIDRIVDSVFANYLSRPGVRQPIFTSYCDGQKATCNGLSQWGSQYLATQGYSAIGIIRYYYGSNMYINSATSISGVPSSWPGYNLTIGSRGDKVRQIQNQLNRIAQNYPAIPQIVADGIYGSATAASVSAFQKIFNLPANGIVDYPTWYKISNVYVAVTRVAE